MTKSEIQSPKQDDSQAKSSRKHENAAELPELDKRRPDRRRPVTPKRQQNGRPVLARQVSHDCFSGINEHHPKHTNEDRDGRSSPFPSIADVTVRQRITLPGVQINTSHNLAECRSPRNGVPPMSNPFGFGSFLSFHTKALHIETTLQPLKQILLRLMAHPTWNKKGLFNCPVDPVSMQAPDYFTVISHPMDLGTIKKKLHGMAYESPDDVIADIRLCFRNAISYNPPTNAVHESAKNLLQFFEDQLQSSCGCLSSLHQQSESEPSTSHLSHSHQRPVKSRNCRHSCPACLGYSCYLCGQGCLPLEHSLLICHGNYCIGARIRKGGVYFISPDGNLIYCQRCYSVLPSALSEIDKDTKSRCRYKSELLKRKNDEEVVEKWVRCVTCDKPAHQVCALFNPFAQDPSDYECPSCSNISRTGDSVCSRQIDEYYTFIAGSEDPVPFSLIYPPQATRQRAFALRRSPTADFMEQKVRELLSRLQNHAEKTVFVRSISNTNKIFQIPSVIKQFFETSKHHHPNEKVAYRSKAFALFQTIDGVDVCLFCMYVNEYEQQSVNSDEKRVYIAYLDSVEYFRPSSLRTEVYQEMIISYLATAKKRGFTNAHIWACPPVRGNSFIFWQHPAEQRTPNMERLTSWYNATLARAANIGIVSDVVSLYESNFEATMDSLRIHEGESRDLHIKMPCPPLLEGDFWVEEALRVYQHTAHKCARDLMSCPSSTAPSLELPSLRDHCPALQLASMLKNKIIDNPSSLAFRRPVNAAVLKIGNYHDIIKEPMDLGTVYTKLSLGAYEKFRDFVGDMELIFANAMKFNPPSNYVHQKAIEVRDLFFRELSNLTRTWFSQDELCPNHSWQAFSERSLLLSDHKNQISNIRLLWTEDHDVNNSASVNDKKCWVQESYDSLCIHRRMAGKDIEVFDKKQNCSTKKQKRKDVFPVSHQVAKPAKRQRQTWLGEEVGRSVRRMRTSFFNCFLRPTPFRVESFDHYCKNFASTSIEPTHESRIAGSRQGFLEFSQLRCLEYDTLRKAKYSTSIILYHLHNNDAPGVDVLCSLCSEEIKDVRWHFLGRVCSKKGRSKFNQSENFVGEELCADCYSKCFEKHLYTPIPMSL